MTDGQPDTKVDAITQHTQLSSTVNHNATIKLTSFDHYTGLRNHRMRFEDAFDINAERVDKPSKLDIIFGRGKTLQDHPGNQRMRKITNKYKHIYHSLQRSQKRNLVENVYKEIVTNGARFLAKTPIGTHYLLVDVEIALQKISSSLRCRKEQKRQLRATKERQNSSDHHLPICGTSSTTSSPILQTARHSSQRKVKDEQCPSGEYWHSCSPRNSQKTEVFLLPSLYLLGSNTSRTCTTFHYWNQCRRLRLMMDARMNSSIAIGRVVNVSSLPPPSVYPIVPRDEALDSKME